MTNKKKQWNSNFRCFNCSEIVILKGFNISESDQYTSLNVKSIQIYRSEILSEILCEIFDPF